MYSPACTVPFEIPMKSRLVVLPDVHRDLAKAKAILRHCNIIDGSGNWKCYDTILVQMGDQIDGGKRNGSPKGLNVHTHGSSTAHDYEILMYFNKLSEQAPLRNSVCVSLMGNHEVMNVSGLHHYADLDGCPMCIRERVEMFRPGSKLCRDLATSRTCILKVGAFLLSHAGVSHDHIVRVNGNLDLYNQYLRTYLLGSGRNSILENVLIGEDGLLSHRRYQPANVNINTLEDVRKVLAVTGTSHMITAHNTTPGVVPIFGNRNELIVFDPGMSRAVADQKPAVLDIKDRSINVVKFP